MSFFSAFYRLWAVALLAFYAWAGFTGWRLPEGPREHMDPSVRSSPGGYRSHYFWHTGFSGGK
jgi:hypothetical protein